MDLLKQLAFGAELNSTFNTINEKVNTGRVPNVSKISVFRLFSHVSIRKFRMLDISQNDGKNVENLLADHANRTNAYMNETWMKDVNLLEATLNALT